MLEHTRDLQREESLPREETMTLRETVGIMPDNVHLIAAIDELEEAEFARQDISVLSDSTERQHVSAYHLMEEGHAVKSIYVMPEEHSLARAALVGAGILLPMIAFMPLLNGAEGIDIVAAITLGALGGSVGYGLSVMLERRRERKERAQERKGGLLLWVHTPSAKLEKRAREILSRHGARAVRLNETTRVVGHT